MMIEQSATQGVIKFSKSKKSLTSKRKYDKIRINIFRTASGFEYDLSEAPITTAITSSCSSETNSSKNIDSLKISHSNEDTHSLNSSDDTVNSIDKQKYQLFSDVLSEFDLHLEDYEDDSETLYSHASILDLELSAAAATVGSEGDMLYKGRDYESRTVSLTKSFHKAIVKKQHSKISHRILTYNQQVPVSIPLYDKVLKGLELLFYDNPTAKSVTLHYLTDTSRRNSGASLLSLTEREILSKLLYAVLSNTNNNHRVTQQDSGMIDNDGTISPWRSSSFHENNLVVSDTCLTNVLFGGDRHKMKKISDAERQRLKRTSTLDDLSFGLGFAGAFLITVGALARLECTIHHRKLNGFLKVKCRKARLSFGAAISGQAPCTVHFQRPCLFSLFKLDRYYALIAGFTHLTNQFIQYVQDD